MKKRLAALVAVVLLLVTGSMFRHRLPRHAEPTPTRAEPTPSQDYIDVSGFVLSDKLYLVTSVAAGIANPTSSTLALVLKSARGPEFDAVLHEEPAGTIALEWMPTCPLYVDPGDKMALKGDGAWISIGNGRNIEDLPVDPRNSENTVREYIKE